MEKQFEKIIELIGEQNKKLDEVLERLNKLEAQSQPPSPGQPPPPNDENP